MTIMNQNTSHTFKNVMDFLRRRVPIVNWLPKYDRTCLISDMIAGITVGLTMLPQSIAYASLVELPAHYGLYTCIMGCFIYIFFGTIKQVSIGPSSLMSIVAFSYVEGRSVDLIFLLTFLAGCVELLMGVLNLGFLVEFISVPVTSGFTSATSIIIIISQIKNIFGIKFHGHSGVFNMIKETVINASSAKISDSILGVTTIVVLLSIRKLSQMKFKNATWNKVVWYMGICRNAFVVLVGTLLACILEGQMGVQPFEIAGKIIPGLPEFKLPPFKTIEGNVTIPFTEMVRSLGSSIIILPVVAVLANVAIAKSFSAGKLIDAGQEMVTLGITNIMGAMVGAMPATGAFTRSAVNHASNIQTPMGGLYAGSIILLALSFLTPYFYFIPKASIAAVLICAVIFMIEYWMIPKLWKCNRYDCFLFIITIVASLYIGVEGGLMVGVIFNMMPLLKLWTRPKIFYELCNTEKHQHLLVTPELGFFFPSVNYVTHEIIKLSNKFKGVPIVLDLNGVLRIDFSACQMLVDLLKTFKKESLHLALLNVNPKVFDRLEGLTDVSDLNIHNTTQEVYESLFDNNTATCEVPLLQKDTIFLKNEIKTSS